MFVVSGPIGVNQELIRYQHSVFHPQIDSWLTLLRTCCSHGCLVHRVECECPLLNETLVAAWCVDWIGSIMLCSRLWLVYMALVASLIFCFSIRTALRQDGNFPCRYHRYYLGIDCFSHWRKSQRICLCLRRLTMLRMMRTERMDSGVYSGFGTGWWRTFMKVSAVIVDWQFGMKNQAKI